jgi:PPOX class probable F420-dependent enzyme
MLWDLRVWQIPWPDPSTPRRGLRNIGVIIFGATRPFAVSKEGPMAASVEPPYPASHRDLLDAALVAVFTAVTPKGQLQSTAIWYLLDDDGKLKMTSTGDRKKVRNLRADPRVALLFMDPKNPYRTLEVRGTATTAPDTDLVLQKKIGVKYDDDVTSHDPPGTVRYVITIEPETVNTFG